MYKCSILVMRKTKIKITYHVTYHFTLITMIRIKCDVRVGKDMKKLELSVSSDGK